MEYERAALVDGLGQLRSAAWYLDDRACSQQAQDVVGGQSCELAGSDRPIVIRTAGSQVLMMGSFVD